MDSERLTREEVEFLDAHSGTTPLPLDEVAKIAEAGRKAYREARYPDDVPHLAELIAALPPGHKDALSVSRFIENAMIDYLGGEVGVRQYLEAGLDPEPVLVLARQADQEGM